MPTNAVATRVESEVVGVGPSAVDTTRVSSDILGSESTPAVITQIYLEELAKPSYDGRITQVQELTLATGSSVAEITQLYVEVLASNSEVTTVDDGNGDDGDGGDEEGDGGSGGGGGDEGDNSGSENYGTPSCPGAAATLSGTLATVRELTFTPTEKTKFLILAQCMAGTTYSVTTDAVQTVLGQAVLLVNGTTVAETDIGNLSTYYCYEGTVGVGVTVTLKAKRLHSDGTDHAYAARLGAIGLNDWYTIEQGSPNVELSGTTTAGKSVLMEDIFEPTFGNSLVFSYAEYNPDETNNTTRGSYAVKLDSASLKNTSLIDMNISQRSDFQEDFTGVTLGDRWSCFSYAGYVDFPGNRTSIKHIAGKYDSSSNAIKFRRLRTVIIPIAGNPFGNIVNYGDTGGTQFTGTATDQLTMSPPPRTVSGFDYLVLAHAKTHVDQGYGPHQLTFRYSGLGMAGTTTNLVGLTTLFSSPANPTALAGVTFGIKNCDILGIKTYNYAGNNDVCPGYNGEQLFGFAYEGATTTAVNNYWMFSATQYQYTEDCRFRTGDRLLSVIQFQNSPTAFTEDLQNLNTEAHDKRLLVEVNLVDEVLRYCIQEDIYLFDGFTTGQILSLIAAGTVDRASAEDLTVNGYEVVSAINAGLTSVALDYLTLGSTVIDGVSTSTGAEYTTLNAVHKLYKKGVIADVSLKDTLPDSLYGVVEVDDLEVELYDPNFELINRKEALQGASIKVRSYDVSSGELRTLGYGTISSINVTEGRKVALKCGNPDTRVLDSKYPRLRVNDLVRVTAGVGETSRLADDGTAIVPVFFGDARRLVVPNIHKYYGSTTTTPTEYLDAYSDYAIGGPLVDNIGIGEDSYFNYVYLSQAYTTTGMYREWAGITNRSEFDDTTIYNFNDYTYGDANIPTLRFASFLITTPTRSTPLGMVHTTTAVGSYDDIEAAYPTLVPVTNVLHVYNFVKGLDWVYDNTGANSNKIGWGFTGVSNQPPYEAVGTTTITITRGPTRDSKDYLLSNNGSTTSVFANIYNVTSVTQRIFMPGSTTVYVDRSWNSSYYDLYSSNELRAFEDIIDWSPTRGYKGYWDFEESLDSGVTSSYTLIGTGGQPYYLTEGCLEFVNSQTLGTCYIPGVSSSNLSMKVQWILYAEVSANLDGNLSGIVCYKNNFYDGVSLSDWKGYELVVGTEDALYGNGVTTRVIPAFSAAYDDGGVLFTSLTGLTTSSYNLADGEVHSIMIVNTEFDGSNGATYLYVDNVLETYDTANFHHTNMNDTTNKFIVGCTQSGYEFEGRIHKLYIDNSSRDEPLPGTTYSVEIQYRPDTYVAEWEYLVYSASNPVQMRVGDAPYVIAGDFRVNGSDLTPDLTVASLVGATNSAVWLSYAYPHGNAIQLNRADYAVTTTGYIAVAPETPSDLSFRTDFCVYAAAKFTGGRVSADLITKESTDTNPSYFVGVTNGFLYASIKGRGTVTTLTTDVLIADDQLHFIMLERDGFDMNLFLDERKVGTTRVNRSQASDYDETTDLTVGRGLVTGRNWVGDVLMVGACNYAPGGGFAAMQTNLLAKGIKGCWASQSDGSSRKTIFHIPFIEGTGTTAASRNLAKNPAYNVKRLLSDPVFGVSEKVDGTSFDEAAEILDDLGIKMDFVAREERTFADILKDMCLVRGMQLKKDAAGRWKVKVDSERDTIRGHFGLNDGYYNNIIEVSAYGVKDIDEQVKTVNLKYRYMPDIVGEPKYHATISRSVSPNGMDVMDIECPYILDHETADRAIDYISKRLYYGNTTLEISVGQEGRALVVGDIIAISIPMLNIDYESFKIVEIGYNIDKIELKLELYSTQIFNYCPGTFPVDESIPTGDDRVGLIS